MEAWATEVLSLWTSNRGRIAEIWLDAVSKNPYLPMKTYTIDDMLQMADGMSAMMAEELQGQGSDIRDMFMNSVIPGILAQGQPLSATVGQITMNGILLYSFLVPLASEENRPHVGSFLLKFYIRMNQDIVKIGLDAGAKV